METFSTRYGYTKPSDVLIRETITPDVQNAICTCYDELQDLFMKNHAYILHPESCSKLDQYLWVNFFNKRKANYSNAKGYFTLATEFIEKEENEWYRKLDLLESTIQGLCFIDDYYCEFFEPISKDFIEKVNSHFERLNYGYKVVDNKIVEITSEEEIQTIDDAMKSSADNIKMHLSKALELYGKRPDGDYSNSIKESISAVEAYCREKTGESTLGDALKKLESKGIVFPKVLKDAFEKLYGYTNDEKTGIRHALMDPTGTYAPKSEEAYFMLVSCSAFINYLRQK